MRGKRLPRADRALQQGITPADAGKTAFGCIPQAAARDHPRGCGENLSSKTACRLKAGSPPRMRGKLGVSMLYVALIRITPADAGKTTKPSLRGTTDTDHPRGCGENGNTPNSLCCSTGSPPRMRGKQCRFNRFQRFEWITPADAGKTKPVDCLAQRNADHPRGCGENTKKIL